MKRRVMGKNGWKLLEIKSSVYNGPMEGDHVTLDESITLNGITYTVGEDVSQIVSSVRNYYGCRSGVCLNNTGLDDYHGNVSTDSTTDTPPFVQDIIFNTSSRGEWRVTIEILSDFKIYNRYGKDYDFTNLTGLFKVVSIVEIL